MSTEDTKGKNDLEDSIDIVDSAEVDTAEVDAAEETQLINQRFDKVINNESESVKHNLTGMYKDWFLDYASYVILERAIPHLNDGLKPVQRRILHVMKKVDDGRYNKVASIIGDSMKFHPHGDSSIGGALVQLGQKDLLIDCQGNWGNILTGDSAAASRYIEARLTPFAKDVLFNAKTTEWISSYDGRNLEPVTLPAKFPLLLAQGAEGIAVGLASKILPHNFIELIDCSISYLKGKDFELFPDFVTGGQIDVSKYNDGLRGGAVKVRAKIVKTDRTTLTIAEIPFGKTTSTLIDSIVKANEKGKIKIKKVDDNTAASAEIVIIIGTDVSADKTIDALYAFTDCEVSISPNCCVIHDNKPLFVGVKQMLRHSADNSLSLLKLELEILLKELREDWHSSSLEKIFIENRIYKEIENCDSWESVLETISKALEPYKSLFKRAINTEDIAKLTEIKIKRTARYNSFKQDEHIKCVEQGIEKTIYDIENIVSYTITYFKNILKKYGAGRERKTEIRSFGAIDASTVAVANAKLYVNRKEGFFGIGNAMKGDEYVCECSDIDDVIVFAKSGNYIITKVSEKAYFEKNIYYIGVFKRNDDRTIYNVLYSDGLKGSVNVKRCAIKGITRDKLYAITKGTEKSQIIHMSINPNGEAEVLKVYFTPRARLKKLIMDLDFSTVAIKGRQSQGNIFTRYSIHKIVLKEKGVSTLEGKQVWFDYDIMKLNNDGRGEELGEFIGDDKTVLFTKSNCFQTSGYDSSLYFPENLMFIEKYDVNRAYSVVYWDNTQKFFYLKRFICEDSDKLNKFIDDEDGSHMIVYSRDSFPQIRVSFGGNNANREEEIIDVEQFIGIKGYKAKGKRITTYKVDEIVFIEPLQKEVPSSEDIGEDNYTDEDMVLEQSLVDAVDAVDAVEETDEEILIKLNGIQGELF